MGEPEPGVAPGVPAERDVRTAVHAEGLLGAAGRITSGPVEGFGVGEHAVQPVMVPAQDADLEMRLTLRPGRGDLVDGAELGCG